MEQKVDQLQALFENNNFMKGDLQLPDEEEEKTTDDTLVGPQIGKTDRKEFQVWRSELTNLTKVVNTFFQNICEYFAQLTPSAELL